MHGPYITMDTRNDYKKRAACSTDPMEEEVFMGFHVAVDINITHNNSPGFYT